VTEIFRAFPPLKCWITYGLLEKSRDMVRCVGLQDFALRTRDHSIWQITNKSMTKSLIFDQDSVIVLLVALIIFTVTGWLLKSALSGEERILGTPADTAGGIEEPVHEDSRAVVVWIISKQTVPLVLLLTRAIPLATKSRW